MTAVESQSFLESFEESTDDANPDSDFWRGDERLVALKDILNCSQHCGSVIDAFMEALCSILGFEAAFMTFLANRCVLRQPSGPCGKGPPDHSAPGFCYWTLVPENPQALVIEDARRDARTSKSKLVTDYPFLRAYVAAPLVTSNGQRVGTICVLDTKPHPFTVEQVAIVCNISELVMRILEGQVLQKKPQSKLFTGEHQMGSALYHQAFALVDANREGWLIKAATSAFDAMTGRESRPSASTFWSLFEQTEEDYKKKQQKQRRGSDCEIYMDHLKPHKKDLPLSASILSAGSEFDPCHQLIGIPCLFSKPAMSHRSSSNGSRLEGFYFILLTLSSEVKPQRTTFVPPIEGLRLLSPIGAGLDASMVDPNCDHTFFEHAFYKAPLFTLFRLHGSFAKVFRGTLRDQKVAVKVVHNLSQNREVDGVPGEAVFMESVKHHNLVHLLQWKITKNSKQERRLWLVMELCSGGSIADAIDTGYFRESPKEDAPLNELKILTVFKGLAEGLKSLHDADIIHCDISGGNVLMQAPESDGQDMVPKICDFGLAIKDSVTEPCVYNGSFPYLAPEVLEKGLVSKASDVYSLGVLFHEILCGERTWGGLHHSQVYYAVVECKDTPHWGPNIPADLRGIVDKLHQYRPDQRLSLAEALKLIDGKLKAYQS